MPQPMRVLSKTKLLSYLQCPKRLWLEVNRPEVAEQSDESEPSIRVGYEVGEIARQLYDQKHQGAVVERENVQLGAVLRHSKELLRSAAPIFEAGFMAAGAMAFTDILLPAGGRSQQRWRMVEVKASTSVKDYHRDDIAIQAFVAKRAGVPLSAVAVAHVDNAWVYQGDEKYEGLLREEDLTEEAFCREHEVETWVREAQKVAVSPKEPAITTGRRCGDPFDCPFLSYCRKLEPQAKYPVSLLPRIQSRALRSLVEEAGIRDMRDVPDELLNEKQRRVKVCTLTNKPFFDRKGAKSALKSLEAPSYFLDFETIFFPVPIWRGTRPYQQIPFQFSIHNMSAEGSLSRIAFLDLSGEDPSRKLAEALIEACGVKGSVFAYNAGFERGRIKELADRYPDIRQPLLAINERIFDLLRLAEQTYYHPLQEGSWSIKKVLPAVAPDLDYLELEGVRDGGMAMDAYLEAIHPATDPGRKEQIKKQLLAYCHMDTLAMVRLWHFFIDGSCRRYAPYVG
jgi:hypothetical protein